VDRQGSRCKKSRVNSCALQKMTTELAESSGEETGYISVVVDQSCVGRLDLRQL